MVMFHTQAKIKVRGQFVQKQEWNQMDVWTDTTDCSIVPANAVDNERYRWELHVRSYKESIRSMNVINDYIRRVCQSVGAYWACKSANARTACFHWHHAPDRDHAQFLGFHEMCVPLLKGLQDVTAPLTTTVDNGPTVRVSRRSPTAALGVEHSAPPSSRYWLQLLPVAFCRILRPAVSANILKLHWHHSWKPWDVLILAISRRPCSKQADLLTGEQWV